MEVLYRTQVHPRSVPKAIKGTLLDDCGTTCTSEDLSAPLHPWTRRIKFMTLWIWHQPLLPTLSHTHCCCPNPGTSPTPACQSISLTEWVPAIKKPQIWVESQFLKTISSQICSPVSVSYLTLSPEVEPNAGNQHLLWLSCCSCNCYDGSHSGGTVQVS